MDLDDELYIMMTIVMISQRSRTMNRNGRRSKEKKWRQFLACQWWSLNGMFIEATRES